MKSIGKEILILNQLDRGATSTVYLVNSIKTGECMLLKYIMNQVNIIQMKLRC